MEQFGLWGVPRGSEDGPFFSGMLVLATLSWGGAGALIGARRPANPISLLLAGEAFLLGTVSFADSYSRSDLPLESLALTVFADVALVPLLIAVPLLVLVFPTGRPPSRRWNWVGWILAASAACGIVGFLATQSENEPTPAFASAALSASGILGLSGAVLAIASVVTRFHRSRGEERAQIRWLLSVALFGAGIFVLTLLAEFIVGEDSVPVTILSSLFLVILTVGLPASIGISILRYRLYELDVVIRKTVIFGIVAVLITVLAVGALLFLTTFTSFVPEEAESGAIAVAMLVVGVLIWPLWTLGRRIADRVVFGGRSSPYEVLTEFSERVGETYSADDVLPRMAHVLGRATGAEVARVWLRVGPDLRPEATWPPDAPPSGPPALPTDPDGDDTRYAAEIRHLGEPLGALEVEVPANDPMNPSKKRLVLDLAAQAGPVLRNVLLVEDLRESRHRIVAAQDEERRKLERNLHDGAQQQIVALSVQLKLARSLVDRDPAKAAEMLDGLQRAATDALEDLRDLARGIYPPLLADKGLAAALETQARRASVPTSVAADGVGRYPQDVESAVYFCALEALNNVAKYADARTAEIRLSQTDGVLSFSVVDDGRGFDAADTQRGTGLQGMTDRIDAVGGTLEILSTPGRGTQVTGAIPV
jgi:signal transduction histidine kinase